MAYQEKIRDVAHFQERIVNTCARISSNMFRDVIAIGEPECQCVMSSEVIISNTFSDFRRGLQRTFVSEALIIIYAKLFVQIYITFFQPFKTQVGR